MSWIWHYSDDLVRGELGEHPEMLLETATLVKKNTVRSIWRRPGLYLKQEFRRGHRLQSEWQSAKLVEEAGIPCVKHLALGTSADGEILITRALDGSLPLEQVLRNREMPEAEAMPLYRATAELAGRLRAAGLYHPDLHTGNVLYVPESHQLALVDLKGIQRWHWWLAFRREHVTDLLWGIPMTMSWKDYVELYALAGAENPEAEALESIKRRRRWIDHDWPKRSRQMLNGYPKFTVIEGDWLRRSAFPLDRLLADGILKQGGPTSADQFLKSFYREFIGIVEPRILAWNRRDNSLVWETDIPQKEDAAWRKVDN